MEVGDCRVKLGAFEGVVSVNNPVLRFPGNPILTSDDVNKVWAKNPHFQVYTVHNAGIAQVARTDGGVDTIMLFRSHIADGRSVIGKATSASGVTDWVVDPQPFLLPATDKDAFVEGVSVQEIIESEAGGVEDLRANHIGNGEYVLTYSAYHETIPNRVKVMMATTSDFKTVVRHGAISQQDMRNVVIFPQSTDDGRWISLLRPNDKALEDAGATHTGGAFEEVRIGHAPTPTGPWGIGEVVMSSGHGPSAFQSKIGPCAPPLATAKGWLSIFHGVRGTMDGNPYSLGVAFHDRADPAKIRMSAKPILMPSASDCKVGVTDYIHVPNVVFCCGATVQPDGTVAIYYGGNDTVMNVGLSHVDVLSALCDTFPQDALTGAHLYKIGVER